MVLKKSCLLIWLRRLGMSNSWASVSNASVLGSFAVYVCLLLPAYRIARACLASMCDMNSVNVEHEPW